MTEPQDQNHGGGKFPGWLVLGWLAFLVWIVTYVIVSFSRARPG